MTGDPLRAELNRLAALTPDQIAADLQARGVQGRREVCWDCPLSNHLTTIDGKEVIIDYDDDGRPRACDSHRSPPIPLPPNVLEFVRRFDAMAYPSLEIL